MKSQLHLIIDIESDIENAKNFVRGGEMVDWFLPVNFQYITSKKFTVKEQNKIIAEYTRHIYALKRKEIERGVADTVRRWRKTENRFLNLVNGIFHDHPWPKGDYHGFASIYRVFPRHVRNRIFFFPFDRSLCDPISVIAHELLHFLFFAYIRTAYGVNEETEFKHQDPRYIWQLSETFNTVIENWKPYTAIIKLDGKNRPYPGCEKMYAKMKRQWAKEPDVKSLLDDWLSNKAIFKRTMQIARCVVRPKP
jgi:hypothetical protein